MLPRNHTWTLTTWLIALIVSLVPAPSYAASAETMKTKYQYSAKVVCSLLLPHSDSSLVQGIYRTAVNVHNPFDKEIALAYKVAISGGLGQEPGRFSVTPFNKVVLQGDGAVEINCFEIANLFCPTVDGICVDFAFIDGFVVIRSPEELNVVGIYTGRHIEGDVETMDVETVLPRKLTTKVKMSKKPGDKKIKKHMPYPSGEGQICGGIAGFPCPEGLKCVDVTSDTCDPSQGGADCPGVCVSE